MKLPRLREPILLGVIAFVAVLVAEAFDGAFSTAAAAGIAVALAYVIHQGASNGG